MQKKEVALAIIGWRHYTNWEDFKEKMQQWMDTENDGRFPDRIVSGGAKGADAMAERFAEKHNIPTTVYRVSYSQWRKDRGAFHARNTKVVEKSTHVLAFPSRNGSGTQDTVAKARKGGLFVMEYYVE